MTDFDYLPQLAADIINNLPDGTTPAEARRALQDLDPLAQTAALATTTSGGSSGGVEAVTALITSAQLLALTPETPIELEPARPGTIFVLVWVVTVRGVGTTPYDPGPSVFVGSQYGPPLYPLGAGSSQSVPINVVDPAILAPTAPLEQNEGVAAEIVNRPLSLFLDPASDQLTSGDHDLTIAIAFMAVPYTA